MDDELRKDTYVKWRAMMSDHPQWERAAAAMMRIQKEGERDEDMAARRAMIEVGWLDAPPHDNSVEYDEIMQGQEFFDALG